MEQLCIQEGVGGGGVKQPPSQDRRKTSRHVVLLALLCIINVHKQKNKLLWMGHGLVGMGTPPSHTSPPQRGQRLDLDVDFKPPPLRFSGYAAGLQRSLRSHGERRKEGGQEKNGGRRLTDFREEKEEKQEVLLPQTLSVEISSTVAAAQQ